MWLCEELGLDSPALGVTHRRADNRLASRRLWAALHLMGIAPVITDGELVLGESGYHFPQRLHLRALRRREYTPVPDDPDFADHLFWFHWSNGTFMTTPMMQLVLAGGGERNPAAVFVEDCSRRGWAMVEARLGEALFFGGRNLTTADIMMVYCLDHQPGVPWPDARRLPQPGKPTSPASASAFNAPGGARWPRPSPA